MFGLVALGLFSGGMLAYGLTTGTMPGGSYGARRSESPKVFRLYGTIWASLAIICLIGVSRAI